MEWVKRIGKIMGIVSYCFVLLFFWIMVISGISIYISLICTITEFYLFGKLSIVPIVILIISYFILYGSIPRAMMYKEVELKIWNNIKKNKHLMFFVYITFFLANTFFLIVYTKHYNETGSVNQRLMYFLYLPVLNIYVYFKIGLKLKEIDTNYSFSRIFSLYVLGRLITTLIKEIDRETINV